MTFKYIRNENKKNKKKNFEIDCEFVTNKSQSYHEFIPFCLAGARGVLKLLFWYNVGFFFSMFKDGNNTKAYLDNNLNYFSFFKIEHVFQEHLFKIFKL